MIKEEENVTSSGLHNSIRYFWETGKQFCILTVEDLRPWKNDLHRGADKSLAPPTSRCILFDGENISFEVSLVIYINSTNILPIMIINRIYENQNLLLL